MCAPVVNRNRRLGTLSPTLLKFFEWIYFYPMSAEIRLSLQTSRASQQAAHTYPVDSS
jgi:hypothetical protein